MELFAEGGSAELASLDIWRLSSEGPEARPPRIYDGTEGDDLLAPWEGARVCCASTVAAATT